MNYKIVLILVQFICLGMYASFAQDLSENSTNNSKHFFVGKWENINPMSREYKYLEIISSEQKECGIYLQDYEDFVSKMVRGYLDQQSGAHFLIVPFYSAKRKACKIHFQASSNGKMLKMSVIPSQSGETKVYLFNRQLTQDLEPQIGSQLQNEITTERGIKSINVKNHPVERNQIESHQVSTQTISTLENELELQEDHGTVKILLKNCNKCENLGFILAGNHFTSMLTPNIENDIAYFEFEEVPSGYYDLILKAFPKRGGFGRTLMKVLVGSLSIITPKGMSLDLSFDLNDDNNHESLIMREISVTAGKEIFLEIDHGWVR